MEIPGNQGRRNRVQRPRPSVAAWLSVLLGLALSVLPTTAHARGRHPLSPRRVSHAAPPWSGTSGFPPRRPLVRVGGPPKEVSTVRQPGIPIKGGPVHPVWHDNARPDGQTIPKLFPRVRAVKKPESMSATARAEREAAMARHPAGKALPAQDRDARCGSSHEVSAGDSLWSIASDALDAEDAVQIASYWPRVYETNREVVGADPALIRPGQVLRLPSCD